MKEVVPSLSGSASFAGTSDACLSLLRLPRRLAGDGVVTFEKREAGAGVEGESPVRNGGSSSSPSVEEVRSDAEDRSFAAPRNGGSSSLS